MPKTQKKAMRKVKDKVIHSANELKAIDTDKMPFDQASLLDKARDHLIKAANLIVEADHWHPDEKTRNEVFEEPSHPGAIR